ncbi:MAG TPA: GGDEF domain-containing protein [Dokdonella sp.]|nr:GGDEF domain-containing protein [Dokdonella sp.]
MSQVSTKTPVIPHTVSLRRKQRLFATFIVLGIALAAIAVQVYRAVGDFVDANNLVSHSQQVKEEITLTVASLHDAEASQRAYIISGNRKRLEDYYATLPKLAIHGARLKDLTGEDSENSASVARLGELIHLRMEAVNSVLAQYVEGGIEAARKSTQVASSLEHDREIDALAESLVKAEEALRVERESRTAEQASLTRVLTVGAVVTCLVILSLTLIALLREEKHRFHSEGRVRSANIELTNSLKNSQQLASSLRQLSELGEMLQGCRNMDEATSGLRVSLPRLLAGTSGSISLINSSKNLIESIADWGEALPAENALFGPNDCWALRCGHAYPPAGSIPAFSCKHVHAEGATAGQQSHLCVPMIAQGEMLGVLTVFGESEISSGDREIAITACEQISLAMANLRLQETLRTQSLRDPLTGLFNRRYLEASFEREVQRADRRRIPLSVLMIDIDHFKRFNDSFGHEAGDTLLAQFGVTLARTVRSEDVSCRYGGEEFTILMPEADADLAAARAEEICVAIRKLDVQHRNLSLGKITVSIGVATFGEHGRTPEELLRNADNALYLAKNSGRDRVMLAETLHPKGQKNEPAAMANVSRFESGRAG